MSDLHRRRRGLDLTFAFALAIFAVWFMFNGYISACVKRYPLTVEAASDEVLRHLSEQQKADFAQMSREELRDLHFTLGMTIRNEFGLWDANTPLLLSGCTEAPCGPDEASGRIIERAWAKLREQRQREAQKTAN